MDREKLDKAAKNFAAWETINSSERMSNFYCSLGFSKGADWLMQQPLSERLTEEEKERIRGLLNYVGENAHDSEVCAMRDELTNIFGEDLFNDK